MTVPFLSVNLLIVAAFWVCVVRGRHWTGTTLSACRWWCCAGLVGLLTVEWGRFLGLWERENADTWSQLAGNLTLCPGIALLGAKRPQDRSWQWIVASFWLILSLPALQAVVMGRGGSGELHPARVWFTWGVILFTAANSLCSRYAMAVVVAAAGQWLLFVSIGAAIGNEGPPDHSGAPPWLPPALIAGAVLLTCVPLPAVPPRGVLDPLWLDFRQAFGLVWTLRLQESVNQIAHTNGWDLRLEWAGFRRASDGGEPELDATERHVLQQALRNHLRRFVSTSWIDQRLPPTPAAADG